MTGKQTILKFLYPAFVGMSKIFGKNIRNVSSTAVAKTSFYDLSITLNDGNKLMLRELKSKKILLVNTASNCGYTAQYAGLQDLHKKHSDKLVIVAFPSNDFGAQEKGSDNNIIEFCKLNFGVRFPLAKKSSVIKNSEQNEVYRWLTNEENNGWNNVAPSWNFCKYLVNEEGNLVNFFESGIDPMGSEIDQAINL